MRKVNRKELEALQLEGVKVPRKMGAGKPTDRTAQKPIKAPEKVAMASMKVSQEHLAAQSSALSAVVAHNTAMIGEFREELKKAVEKANSKVGYTFDIERGTDKYKLLTRIVARPILEGT